MLAVVEYEQNPWLELNEASHNLFIKMRLINVDYSKANNPEDTPNPP